MKKVITLFALAITALSFNASAQRAGEFTISQKEVTAEDFTNWFVSYDASLDNFDKGSYGIGWVTYGENGFGATMSAHGSWGLVDPGSLMFQFGPVYGYPVTEQYWSVLS